MSSLTARVFGQNQLAYVPHTSISGDQVQRVRKGTATSNGAANGTTLIDSSIGGSDDDLNGRYIVRILSGAAKGQEKLVVDYVASSGTVTLENNGFSGQISTGDEYELVLTPDPTVVVDSSSGATNVVDAIRAEADDFWNGYYLIVIHGSQRGRIAHIADFTSATGTFTLTAAAGGLGLTGALTAGNVCVIRKFVEVAFDPPANAQGLLPRPGGRVNFARAKGTKGPKSGAFNFRTQIRPSGSLAADGSKANPSEIAGLFQGCGLEETVATTTLAGAGSSTTAIKIATGTWERFAVGQAIGWKGNVTFVESMEDGGGAVDTLNVNPPLPAAPAASDPIYASRMYAKTTDGDVMGVLLELEIDGVRQTMFGCKGNVTLQSGDAPELAWSFMVAHWIRERESAPYNPAPAYSTANAVIDADRIVYLDNTKYNVSGFTADPGAVTVPKGVSGRDGVNGIAGFQLTDIKGGGTWRELLDSTGELDQDERFYEGTEFKLAVIYGSHGTCFAARMPKVCQITAANPENADGLAAVPAVFEAYDAGVASDGASALQKNPDFAFHIF